MKVLIDYDWDRGEEVKAYIFANGDDPDRYFRSKLPHPLSKFDTVILDYKPPRKKRTPKKCVCKE